MSGTDDVSVYLPGQAMVGLVRAIASMGQAQLGPYAIVGGVAVSARLGQAHRATADVDAVVDQDHLPAAIGVLRGLATATPDPGGAEHRVYVDGTKVEILEVGPIPADDALRELSERQRLFVLAHGWALATAEPLTVIALDEAQLAATAPFATPAALVAMKLHAIQDRSGEGQAKRAGDAWDIHQLLAIRNARGDISAAFLHGPEPLRREVATATQRILVDGATRTRGWLRSSGGLPATVTADELEFLGRQLLTTIA
jgi:hypothetical protein